MMIHMSEQAATENRLAEAIKAVGNIVAPSGTLNADELELALDRMKTHATEIEAVYVTLRQRGVVEADFASAVATLTPGDVAPTMAVLSAIDKLPML
jgi:hypothetical protein